MKKHLSDEFIQQFVFDASECEPDVHEHMASCAVCKKKAESYLALSNTIRTLPEPRLAFDLTNRVLTQLDKSSGEENQFNPIIYSLIALGVVVVISSLIYCKEVLFDLFKSHSAISMSLIISVALMITAGMIADTLRSYGKKISLINY